MAPKLRPVSPRSRDMGDLALNNNPSGVPPQDHMRRVMEWLTAQLGLGRELGDISLDIDPESVEGLGSSTRRNNRMR